MERMFKYTPMGVCAREMQFDIIEGKVKNVKIVKGCTGNTNGIARLIDGMDAREAVRRIKGIACKGNTSCPDQLAIAIENALNTQK